MDPTTGARREFWLGPAALSTSMLADSL